MNWDTKNIPDLSGKVIIVTGGNSGIGYEAVKAFAEKGAEVVFTCRNNEKGKKTKASLIEQNPGFKVFPMELELTDLQSIKHFSESFKSKYKKLDVLLNNAGIMMTPYALTKDGFESQIGTNHLGHFALTGHLFPLLIKTPGSRIVTISSGAHKFGKMDFDNFLYENGKGYSPMKAYGRSKISNLLFTYELQRKLEKGGNATIAVAAHPGVSDTNLGRSFEHKWFVKLLMPVYKLMIQDASMGALPGIRAAVDPDVAGGDYFGPGGRGERTGYPIKVSSNPASHNMEDAKKLWELSEKLTGVKFEF